MTNRGPNRTLEDALRNAERIRKEIPLLVQPEDTAYDMVLLADEIYTLRRGETTTKKKCHRWDAFFDPTNGSWLESTCGDITCEYCADRPGKHPDNCTHSPK